MSLQDDPDRAEGLFERALTAAPNSDLVLGSYALFLQTIRKDADLAEEYHRRALEADPTNANILGNYAQLLFVLDRDAEARRLLERASAADPPPSLAVELVFYRYAHVADERDAALGELYRQVADGVRSPGWDLSANVDGRPRPGTPSPACRPIWPA